MMASDHIPRITYEALVDVGNVLDRESPTRQDWRVLASYLGKDDMWIQSTESKCLPTGKSPTAYVLRAWEEQFKVFELLPVREQLIACLTKMNRMDAASTVEQMMKAGTFLDPVKSSPHSKTHSFSGFSGCDCETTSHQTCCCTCQTGQHTSQTNDSTGRSNKSAQENSYYGPSNPYPPQGYPERCIGCVRRKKAPTGRWEHQLNSPEYYQPHRPKNGQSVVSLSSAISDKSENLPLSSHQNNTKTWPLKKGNDMNTGTHDRRLSPGHVASRREIRYQPNPMELETLFRPDSNYHPPQDDDRPFHSLVSRTSMDRYDHGDGGAHAAHGRFSVAAVDRMMMENPERASPSQTMKSASVLITYAYKNYQAAHKLAKLLIDQKHEVTVDTKVPIKDLTFTSVTYVIIIYTPEYVNEVIGKVKSPLNTRNIYVKMDEEFRRQGNRNIRFVPLFDHDRISSDSIPRLLRKYPEQPLQYICKILDPSQDTPKQDTPKRGGIPIQTIMYSSR